MDTTDSPAKKVVIELSATEREILIGMLSLGITQIDIRARRGEKGHDGQLRAARRILNMLKDAK